MHRELTFKKSDPIQLVANQSRGSYRHAISRNFIPHESKMRDFGLWKETGAPGQKKKKKHANAAQQGQSQLSNPQLQKRDAC